MRLRARFARVASLMTVLALFVPMVVGTATAQDDGTIRMNAETWPDVFDPQKSSYTNEISILTLAYEGLTKLDPAGATIPGSAESWEYNEDATQLTFKLRPDLKFSDGSPLTAENFRYAVERTCSPRVAGEYQSILFEIAGCAELAGLGGDDPENPVEFTDDDYAKAVEAMGAKVIDDQTLQLTLTQPAPYMHTIAMTWVFYPVKKEIAEADPDNWWKKAEGHVGNGPFKITAIEDEQMIRFEGNENYYAGLPAAKAIEYRYVEESAVALEAFRAGDLDIIALDPSQILEVQGDPELSSMLVSYPLAGTIGLQFNLTQEPFTDQKVREAFSHAFDRETYCAEIRNGDCSPTLTWIPDGVPGHITVEQFGFDAEAAVAALAASSYGGPEGLPEIRLYYNSDDPANTERMEWVAGQYRDVLGVEIILEPTEGTALTGLKKDPKTFPQMSTGGWYQDYPDPQNWLSVFWTCAATFAQRVSYCNEELDALVKQGDTTVDPVARIAFYEQAGQVLVDSIPGPFLYNPTNNFLVNPAVTGWTATSADSEWPGEFSAPTLITKGS
ncbi:MAG: ABC transporter substrate-binding protein [Chloroflexota bacterium]